MNRNVLLGLLLALAAALALQIPRLGWRPMHNDEAVNAIKFRQLWEEWTYKYDPNEHHGPSLYYATLALGRLTGAPDFDHFTEARLRSVTVLFGVGLLLLLPLVADGLGRRGLVWAGLFTAISPAVVFYSRYYIHEILLVFFTFLALAAGWRYWRTRRLGWALLAGAGLGLMEATKETFVLTLAAAGLALVLNLAWTRLFDASQPPVPARPLNWRHLLGALVVWLGIALVLFSSFFTNASGPLDSLRTYLPWLHRAEGASPHRHPWTFFLQRLLFFHVAKGPVWTEGFIFVLALVAAWTGFARKRLGRANATFVRFLALYAGVLMVIYNTIPYKTPWCLLNFWQPMILLAGVGAAVLARSLKGRVARVAITLLLLAGAGHLAWQARQAAVTYAADQRNPYVYAQTSPDILRLVNQVQSLAEVYPHHYLMLVKVIAAEGDYWPLPWYLRAFKQIGWWDHMPADPYAPVMIVSPGFRAGLDDKKTHVMIGYFELRPQVFFELYVQLDLWRAWLERHPPKPEG